VTHNNSWVEKTYVDAAVFDEQYQTFNTYGYAANPSDGVESGGDRLKKFVGDLDRLHENKGMTVSTTSTLRVKNDEVRMEKRKRKQEYGDAADPETFKGPWAPSQKHLDIAKEVAEYVPTEEQKAIADEHAEKKQKPEAKEDYTPPEEKSEFHGTTLRDYQGRSYIHIPSDMKLTPPERCYVPKKWIHTW
jgi:pre-mRNA-processing factor 17